MIARRPQLVLAALAAVAGLAACSGDDDATGDRAAAPPAQLPNAVRLQREYTLNGRAHRGDAKIAFDHVIDPYRAIASAPPPNARFVGAQLHILNRGPDPFPIQWARFRGYDERGRPPARRARRSGSPCPIGRCADRS